MASVQSPLKQRLLFPDVARVFAILSITLNHAVNRSYSNFSNQTAEFYTIPLASTLFKTVISVFSRIGVPVFLMITGFLLLNKKLSSASDVKRFYKHNLLSLFITTEIWYVLMFWFLLLFSPTVKVLDSGIPTALVRMVMTMLFQNQVTFSSMWYMPMILSIYLTIPFVIMLKDRFSDSLGRKVVLVPLGAAFVVCMVIPAANAFFGMMGVSQQLESAVVPGYLIPYYYIYVILGYWVGQGGLSRLRGWMVASATAGVFLIMCGYQFFAYSRPGNYLIMDNFPLMPLCAGGVFELCRRAAPCLRRWQKPISGLARMCFAIYFLHIVIMTVASNLLGRFTIPVLELRPVKLLFLEVVSVGCSIPVIWLLGKIPVLKKYLFLIK